MEIVLLGFQIGNAFTAFVYGLHGSRDELYYLVRRPRLLALTLVAVFIVTPVAAIAVSETLDLSRVASVAIIALALSPVSPFLRIQERKAGGSGSLGVGLAFAVAFGSVLISPLLVAFAGDLLDRPYDVSARSVLATIGLLVFEPLMLGFVVAWLVPSSWDRIGLPLSRVANRILLVATVCLLIVMAPSILELIDLRTVLGMTLFTIAAVAAGHLIGGPDPNHASVLGLACANRYTVVALTIASVNFPEDSFVAAVVLCSIIQYVVFLPYIRWHRRRLTVDDQPFERIPPPGFH